jgi:catechol 2,3-dioxygenase-like lactoylglutathione lyase family enzyme
MQPRVDLISLGVRSVDASRRFYVDGLGWPVHREVPGEVLFIQANHGLVLSLRDAGQLQSEAATDPPAGIPCITLSHNLGSAAEVAKVMADARTGGAGKVTL